jgi:hypothetical protein
MRLALRMVYLAIAGMTARLGMMSAVDRSILGSRELQQASRNRETTMNQVTLPEDLLNIKREEARIWNRPASRSAASRGR